MKKLMRSDGGVPFIVDFLVAAELTPVVYLVSNYVLGWDITWGMAFLVALCVSVGILLIVNCCCDFD